MRLGILGGGLSGVTLQSAFSGMSEILEKEVRIGGLCRTFHKDDFYYDIGGHILFSKDQGVLRYIKKVLADNFAQGRRVNKILLKGRYIKYPFENGLSSLEKEDIFKCLVGFLKADLSQKPKNFLEWIYCTFGRGIAENYLVPYNRKIWKVPLESVGMEWVGRVPRPSVEEIVKSALGIETEGYIHQLNFYYPAFGGIESLVKSILKPNKRAAITTGFEVKSIRRKKRQWCISGGDDKRYFDKLVVTIPVKEAVRYLDRVPHRVRSAAESLRHYMVRVVMVGVRNSSLLDKSAIYLPQEDVLFHRVCYMGYFSRQNVPKGKSSLIAEMTTYKNHDLYKASNDVVIERTLRDLHRLGIIDKREVCTTEIQNIEFGYIFYDLGYQKHIRILKAYFNSLGIELLGRFAEFEYINMDEVILRSLRLAGKLNALKGKLDKKR